MNDIIRINRMNHITRFTCITRITYTTHITGNLKKQKLPVLLDFIS